KSGHDVIKSRCPLYPQKRTWIGTVVMSALCHMPGGSCNSRGKVDQHLSPRTGESWFAVSLPPPARFRSCRTPTGEIYGCDGCCSNITLHISPLPVGCKPRISTQWRGPE